MTKEDALDPALVGLCLDTGHTVYGGGDALDTARRYAARVVYVHAKDVDGEALVEARRQGMGLLDGLRRGVFSPVYGTAAERSTVDIDAVGTVLREAGFHGWVIQECDRNPRAGDPAAEAEAARARLARAFGA
jgi:inosose dehydratase